MNLYTRLHYIPSPYTCYSNVMMVPPAHLLAVDSRNLPSSIGHLRSLAKPYWSPNTAVEKGLSDPMTDENLALEKLDATLRTAVEERLVADVPVGAFLSGGIDSSLVTAIMQEISPRPVKTFTIRFAEAEFNEAGIATDIARHLGTEHQELAASPGMALEIVDSLADVYDEPFADASQIPTIAVSKLAREHVTVALSGDGGDEFFAGYKRYPQVLAMDRLAKRLPRPAVSVLDSLPFPILQALFGAARGLMPAEAGKDMTADRLKKLLGLLREPDFDRRYLNFMSEWNQPSDVLEKADVYPFDFGLQAAPAGLGDLERMMYRDMMLYLPSDVLVKVDRASMAFGLEMRAPLLDYRLVELAWQMPPSLRLNGGTGKIALRKLLAKRLPESIVSQPKRGFGIPLNSWLRGPLKTWAGDMLSDQMLQKTGMYIAAPVRKRWREHLSGKRNWGSSLWTILMYQCWYVRHHMN
jgi:asparagine synthase (glutamine-hydrolysing)